MSELKLTPTGHLRWEAVPQDADTLPPCIGQDAIAGIFKLAAEKSETSDSVTLRYWQSFAQRYLTKLCHIEPSDDPIIIEPLTVADCAALLSTAPPMSGGEYLNQDVLQTLWSELNQWTHLAITKTGGLPHFLQQAAPKWHQVGRVCFHLAENKADSKLPFAFMATYATGFGSGRQLKHLPLRNALQEYIGKKNRSALIKLLAPVQQASQQLTWVNDLLQTNQIYQPLAWSPKMAYQFLQDVPEMESAGLTIHLPNWWKKRPRAKVAVTIGQANQFKLGAEAILDFDVKVALGDQTLSMAQINQMLKRDEGLVLFKGQWIEVDREKLHQAITHWQKIEAQEHNGTISFIQGMRLLAGASVDLKDDDQATEKNPWIHVSAGAAMRKLLANLREPTTIKQAKHNPQLKATLRPYQQEGVTWLSFLTKMGLGACLADDMGLGKTIQVLALLLENKRQKAKAHRKPSLLILPASLLGNWHHEAERFSPSLKLTFLHPAETTRQTIDKIAKNPKKHLTNTDLVITTYAMLARQTWLQEIDWQYVILDEAQAIKNPSTKQAKAVKKLSSHARIAMTGTPIENSLGDLWSLFDYLNPGLLGSAAVFKKFTKQLQDRTHDQFSPLRQLTSPYILRRMKTDRNIISDLPNKTEVTCYCNLSTAQVKLYHHTVETLKQTLKSANGMARRGAVLQSLMRLKQICNHPSQLNGDDTYLPKQSGKFLRIKTICEEIAARQEKVLVFTQFRELTQPLSDFLATSFGTTGLILHGGTAVGRRKKLVTQFQNEDGPPFFILSLKAGGTGLNLTQASHVIHFDRWWNPAVENQATDRAFRIGQKQNVLVHKVVTTGTLEERIDLLLAEKQQMANQILASNDQVNLTELPDEDILRLVQLDINRAKI